MVQVSRNLLNYFRRGRWLRVAALYVRHPARMVTLTKRVRGYISKDGLREIGTLLLLLWHYVTDIAQGKYKDYIRKKVYSVHFRRKQRFIEKY